MSIKVKYDQAFMNLMGSIFYKSTTEEDEFVPIVKDMNKIPNIISFINSNNNLQMNLDNNISLVFFLKNLFSENNDLMPLFIKRCVKDKRTFLESLVNLYLEEKVDGQSQTLLEDLINNINYNVSVDKSVFEFIYQKLSYYFNVDYHLKSDKITYLSEKDLLKYLRLLNIFYTDLKNENADLNEKGEKKDRKDTKVAKDAKDAKDKKEKTEKKSKKPENKIIRNYFYLNGLNSRLTLSLNKSSNNINIDNPTLVEGLTLVFYANFDKDLLDYYFKNVLSKTNEKVSLIKLFIGVHTICLELKDSETISIVLDDCESNKIKISNEFKYNLWNSIILLIEPKSMTRKGAIKIAVNECVFVSSLSLPKNFNVNEKVDEIILFENLLGKVTSISLFSFQIDDQLLNFFNSKLYGGFYKNRLLFRFLHSIDKKFGQTIHNYSEYERFKKDEPTGKIYNISIGSKDIHKNRIISTFCPFLYNQFTNIIDDVFGIFTGKLNSEYDGVNIYSNNIKNVVKLGGINNLLPLAELMLFSLKHHNYFIEKNLLTEDILLEYLKIIKQILNNHKESIYDLNNNYFFSSLALFLEKFPPSVFTINIINIFIEICKETFRYKIGKDNDEKDKSSINYRFISIIIFNGKIFSKFTFENQLKLWNGIYNLFKKDYKQIKESLDIPHIFNLLRYYDKDRYQKYCCKKHALILGYKIENENENENEIMKPEINSRIGKLFDIIQLYLDKVESEKDQDMILYNILSLDLSSCLKKKIVQIYLFHLINDKNSDKAKERTLFNLLNNNYFEVTEYCLSTSLLDVRCEIFKLLHYIVLKYKDKIVEHINKSSLNQNQIFSYISGNIIPMNVKIRQTSDDKKAETNNIKQLTRNVSSNYYNSLLYKDNLLGNIEDQNLLAFYFDQKLYDEDINFMWGLLNSWITENAPVETPSTPNSSSNAPKEKDADHGVIKFDDKYSLLINPFILGFTIDFVSNLKPSFIDSFLASISSYLKDDGIQNKDVIIKDRKFFQWLIDTIFFFHNKENESVIDAKDLISSIQKNSLEVMDQLFKIKTSLKDIENKVYYLMEYSFYFKNRFSTSNNNLKEIVRITRLILEKLLKSNEEYFNIISIFCFEFMFLHKNNEEVLSNFNCKFQRNSLLDTESLNKTIKKSKEDDSASLKKKSTRVSVEFEDIDIRSAYNTESSISMNISSYQTNPDSSQKIEADLIPTYLYQGIYSIQQNPSQVVIGTQSKKILKNIWSDYNLYSTIINHYRKNIWGAEELFKAVKMEYKSADILLESCQNLLKNYGEQKEYKNILFEKIKKLLIIDDDFQNGINKINLLYLNLILLCFSLDIAGVLSEQEEITQLIIEFLIFCIMVSININQTENTYNYIQKKLYDTISFGLLFLQEKDQVKFRELMYYLIEPFFEGVTSRGNLKKIFGSKKNLYKNTAIYKVFIKTDESAEQKTTKLDEAPKKKEASGSVPKKKFTSLLSKNISKKSKDDKKKGNKLLLFLRSYPAQVTKSVFGRVVNFYKEEKYLFNKDNNLFLFYFKKESKENEKDKENANSYDYLIEAEKKRINIFMRKLIPKIFSEINKSSICSYLEDKKRRNRLKKTKKSLFSWNGFWSNKKLFFIHPEYLKFKIKNHFCKDMSKILLSPILDLNYYLPKFSKFDVSNLFNKDDYKYNICMDIDEILNSNDINENQNIAQTDLIIKNNYNFNYLESLYKYQYSYIWDNYYNVNYIEQKNNDLENKTSSAKEIFELLFQNKLNTINEENVQSENIYTCCIVKPTHHIKGYATTEKTCITFTYCPDNETKELLEKDPSYDKDMGACFGSTFKRYYKDKDIIGIEILYKSIEFMFIRNYFYQETGLEIYTYEKKSYFLNFKSKQELLKFINDILQHEKFRFIKCHGYKHKKLLGYCKLFNVYPKKKSLYPAYIMDEWQNNNISTFECLMWLNIFAGRSFNDLTQYPVFPWIITNYQTEELTENDFRNLSIPVGMFDFNEKAEMRKETFIEFYDTLKNDLKESTPNFHYDEFLDKFYTYFEHYNNKKSKKDKDKDKDKDKEKDADSTAMGEGQINKIEINQLPYFYGSHYSNPTYVSHYLTRLFPHASISIEIHGDKFDDPNRMFISLNRTFETASTLKDDIRELIPEFYVLPEMFLNNNNFNLSQDKLDSEGNKISINEVELPPWSNNRNVDFVIEMRKNLEKLNLKINKWIDLIFGYLQKGEKAEENHNIFMLNTYEGMVNIENIKDVDEKNALMRLVEVGVTPTQIFSSESKPRNDMNQILAKGPYSNSKELFLWECNELGCFKISLYKYHKIIIKFINDYKQYKDSDSLILPRITKIKAVSKNELRIFTNCNYWFNIKIVKNENKYTIEESTLYELYNISSKFAPAYQISNIQTPIVVFGNNKFIIRGGFWDGRLEINVLNLDSKEEKDNINFCVHNQEGPVVVMEISKNEDLLICGTMYGFIVAYQIEYINNNSNIKLNLIKKLYDHNSSINSISINDNLNIFATCANEENIYLYLLPTFEVFRVIKISEKNFGNNYDENELLVANNVFLSNCPLPCLSIFINSKRTFKIYTINGEYIGENQETNSTNSIKCSIIFNDFTFCDYVIYGTDDGMVKIRSFPDMNLINTYSSLECYEIACLELSLDKRYCYAWSKGGDLLEIKDIAIKEPSEVEQKKFKFK